MEKYNSTPRMEADLIESKISEVIDCIKYFKDSRDFLKARYILEFLFENLNTQSLASILMRDNRFINIFDDVFSNMALNEYFQNILIEEERIRIENRGDQVVLNGLIKKSCIKEKQLVYQALCLSSFLLANCLRGLSSDSISYMRGRFRYALKNIQKYQGGRYTIANICFKLHDIGSDFSNDYRESFSKKIDFERFITFSKSSRYLVCSMLLVIPQYSCLESTFSEIIKKKQEVGKFSLLTVRKAFSKIFNVVKKINGGLEFLSKRYLEEFNDDGMKLFQECFNTSNEKSLLYIFERFAAGFQYQEGRHATDILLEKIDNATMLKQDFYTYASSNFRAFLITSDEKNIEWANRVYLISNKTLSTLEAIRDAVDTNWKTDVAIYELIHWIEDVHGVLNRFNLEDDWEKVDKFVIQENDSIEWKSSFFTSMQEPTLKEGDILRSVVKPLIGMMNTVGGVIIVGLVEKTDLISDQKLLDNIFHKNGRSFFNVDYELEKRGIDMDDVKRRIQDVLHIETQLPLDAFDGIWSIEPIKLNISSTEIKIYMISVKKAKGFIFSVKKENDCIWISLTKRIDGRTIKVDCRNYL